MYAVNTYGFSADNRRSCIPVHWKSIAQRHWADIILAFEWIFWRELQTYATYFFLSFFFLSTAIVTTSDISVQVSISPIIYLFMFVLFVLNSHRNIWNEDEERISLGRYCERGDNVSAVRYARCPLLILFIWSHLQCIVLTGLFSRSKCHRIFEFS